MYFTKLLTNITLSLYALSDVYNIQSYGRVKTYIEENMLTNPYLSIISGDFISPIKYTNLDGGKLIMDIFNIVPIDIASLGNHEFDIIPNKLNSSLEYNKQTTFISTNIKYISNTQEYYIYQDILSNLTLGFIGLCSSNFYHKFDIQFDTDKDINQTINFVKSNYNPDYIIGLTHATLKDDYEFIDKFPQLDLVLGGHIHTYDYSIYKGVPIIRTGENVDSLFRIDFLSSKSFEINLIDISHVQVHNDIHQIYLEGEKNFELFNKEPLFNFNSIYSNKNPRTTQESLPTLICSLITKYFNSDLTLLNSGIFKLKGKEFKGIFSVGNYKEFMPYNDMIIIVKMNKTDLVNGIKYSNTHHYGEGGFLQSDINLSNFDNYLDKFENKNTVLVSISLLMIKGVDLNPYFTKYYNTQTYVINNGMYVYNIIIGYKGIEFNK
jgi:5'-nucleotidase / UDP-sugar diphosphatase